jgi:hypothetical protein
VIWPMWAEVCSRLAACASVRADRSALAARTCVVVLRSG